MGPLNLETILGFLLDAPFFSALDAAELSDVVHVLQVVHVREGQVLFQVGQPGEAWYVVYDGAVDVLVPTPEGPPQLLERLRAPDAFGEIAMLDGSPRSAMVRAATDGTVLRVPRDAFHQLLREGNLGAYKLVHRMAESLARRHRETTHLLVDLVSRIDAAAADDVRPALRARRRAE